MFFGGVKFPSATTPPHHQLKTNTCAFLKYQMNAKNTNPYKAVYTYTFRAKLILRPCNLKGTKTMQLKMFLV